MIERSPQSLGTFFHVVRRYFGVQLIFLKHMNRKVTSIVSVKFVVDPHVFCVIVC